MATITICVCLAAAVFWGAKSYRKRLVSGCCGTSGAKAVKRSKVKDRDLSHYPYCCILTINGMFCGNCAIHVENALNGLNGVWARVNLEDSQATVNMKLKYEDKILIEAVREAGYTVSKIESGNDRQRGVIY